MLSGNSRVEEDVVGANPVNKDVAWTWLIVSKEVGNLVLCRGYRNFGVRASEASYKVVVGGGATGGQIDQFEIKIFGGDFIPLGAIAGSVLDEVAKSIGWCFLTKMNGGSMPDRLAICPCWLPRSHCHYR